jgi:hypothetical protein
MGVGGGVIFFSVQKSLLFGDVFGYTKLRAIMFDNRMNTHDMILTELFGRRIIYSIRQSIRDMWNESIPARARVCVCACVCVCGGGASFQRGIEA